jgi:hypothetical protein
MKLTEEQIQDNWIKLVETIDTQLPGDKRSAVIGMYNDLEARLLMAPASGFEHFHNSFPGGYVDHVNRVVECTERLYKLWKSMGSNVDGFQYTELLFVALNHDLGKVGDMDNDLYVPNQSDWHRQNQGKIYTCNDKITNFMSVPDRSIWLLNQYGVKLSEQEYLGIKLHNGLYEEGNGQYLKPYSKDRTMSTSLPIIIHQADMMASRIEYEMWKTSPQTTTVESRKAKRSKPKEVSMANDSAKDVFKNLFGNP